MCECSVAQPHRIMHHPIVYLHLILCRRRRLHATGQRRAERVASPRIRIAAQFNLCFVVVAVLCDINRPASATTADDDDDARGRQQCPVSAVSTQCARGVVLSYLASSAIVFIAAAAADSAAQVACARSFSAQFCASNTARSGAVHTTTAAFADTVRRSELCCVEHDVCINAILVPTLSAAATSAVSVTLTLSATTASSAQCASCAGDAHTRAATRAVHSRRFGHTADTRARAGLGHSQVVSRCGVSIVLFVVFVLVVVVFCCGCSVVRIHRSRSALGWCHSRRPRFRQSARPERHAASRARRSHFCH